jgi:hypothetical protein
VAEAPAGAQERGLVAAAFAADQRRHGREMIRFERVAHAEQRAEARTGHEFDNWHGVAILPEIPRRTSLPTARPRDCCILSLSSVVESTHNRRFRWTANDSYGTP